MTRLGVYYGLEHHRQSDRDYIQKLQPPVIRLLDPDVQQIADMHALCPDAVIACRTWVIDDNNGAAVRNLMADPIKAGIDHANQYSGQLGQWREQARQRGLTLPPDDRIYFNAANEPNQGGSPDKIAAYTVAFLNRCTELNIRATALCLGVGWPDNSGPGTPVNWQPYASIVAPIQRGQHWLELHEYNYKTGPQENWTWWAGRHLQCPFDVPILLGEIGVDCFVDKARWDKEGGNRGWLGNVDPNTYADMIQWHIQHSDTRVVAALPFLTDYRKNEWRTFDTDPANGALLARKDAMVPQTAPKTQARLPSVSTPPAEPQTQYVNAPAGLRLRTLPNADAAPISIAPYGEKVDVVALSQDGQWAKVSYKGQGGWMYRAYLSDAKPQPVTQPQPAGDNWSRAWPIVLDIEGGLSTDRNDTGNYRPDGTFVGTKFGISANAHPDVDIVNLTKEQALAIYKTQYWDAAGCGALAWPLCLVVFDTAVNHGVGVAKQLLSSHPTPEQTYLGQRALRYFDDPKWPIYGIAWGLRVKRIEAEASK